MMHPLDAVRWLFRNEPAVTLALCGVLATLIVKWVGVDLTGAELSTAIAALLGVGVATRQVVRPDSRAKDEIKAAYQLGHIDHEEGRFDKNILPTAAELARRPASSSPVDPRPPVAADMTTWQTADQPTPPGGT